MARRVAIIGAGPVGIEAALRAREDGYEVRIYERGEVGENLGAWGHVRMFSPGLMNLSARARDLLDGTEEAIAPDHFPTGEELRRALRTLGRGPLEGLLLENTRVVTVAREGQLKADNIGGPQRASTPFRILLETGDGSRTTETADVVIDASGTFHRPRPCGSGGIPAPGEEVLAHRGLLDQGMPDFLGDRRGDFAGRRTLVLGAGHTAATNLLGLALLLKEEPGTGVIWAWRSDRAFPFTPKEDDPLPERRSIETRANAVVESEPEGLTVVRGATVDRFEVGDDGVRVHWEGEGAPDPVVCDRVVANVGASPDESLYRELQIHQCYATAGPIKLAAALLGETSSDCLAQTSKGVETLLNPEPDFFILGMKSYGTAPNFLLRIGHAQVEDIFDHLKTRP